MRFILLFTFLTCLFGSADGLVAPIPSSELYRTSNEFSYQLSPSSKYVAHNYKRKGNIDVIELLDIENNKKGDLLTVKIKEYANIRDFFWIDEDTVYVNYGIGENQNKRIFIDIDFDKFNNFDNKNTSKDDPYGDYTKSSTIEVEGIILDSLRYIDNTFIFQRKRKGRVEVYQLTTEKLLNNDLVSHKRLKPEIPEALTYITDNQGKVRFGYNIEKEAFVYWYLDEKDDKWIKIYTYDGKKHYFHPIGLLNENKLAVITDIETDLLVVMEYDMKTKVFGEILYQHQKYDVVGAEVSRKSQKLLSVAFREHGRLLHEYFSEDDTKTADAIKKHLPNKQFFTYSESKNSDIKIVFGFASDDSGRFYWFNARTKKIIPLNPVYKNHEKLKFTKSELLTVRNNKGQDIEAFLTRPKDSNGVLLVSPHGGPIGVSNTDGFSRQNQYFASRGYSILNVNFRGSTGFGKKFRDAGRSQFGKDIEEDITTVVNHVQTKYHFKQFCSIGASYGGYSALMLAVQNPETYDCAIGQYGIYDLPLLFNRSNTKIKEKYINSVQRVLGEQSALVKEQSPINLVEKLDLPILLIAGKEDDISGFEQSNRMKYRLLQLNKDVETMFYAETGHGNHKTWRWEWHELAVVDDFIRRKLDLSVPATSPWNKIIAKEALIIADSFEIKDKVKNDPAKGLRYLKTAANANLPRALHNLAVDYRDGELLAQDLDKALELYKKASKLGWAKSSSHLGDIYRDGEIVKKDLMKAYEYYLLADGQKDIDSKFEILRFKCLGWAVKRDIGYCISEMSKTEKMHGYKKIILSDIMMDEWPSSDIRAKIMSYLSSENVGNLVDSDDWDIEELEDIGLKGVYYDSTGMRTVKSFVDIGSRFLIREAKFNKKDRVLLKLYWTLTNLGDKKIISDKKMLFYAKVGERSSIRYRLNRWEKKINSRVRLVVKNLDNKVLLDSSYDHNYDSH